MTIQQRLITISAAAIVPLAITTAMSFFALSQVDPQKSALVSNTLALSNQMRADMMHDALRGDVQQAMIATSAADFESVDSDVRKHVETIRQMFSENLALAVAPSLHNNMETLKAQLEAYGALTGSMVQAARADKAQASARLPEFQRKFAELEDAMGKFDDALEANTADSRKAAIATVAQSKTVMLTTGGLAIVLLLFAAVWVSRSIGGELRSGIGQLGRSAQDMASAANEIASSSQSVAQGSAAQAATLEELSSSSEEISSMAKQNLDNCRSATQLVQQSQQNVDSANVAIDHMVEAMAEIHAQSGRISKIIKAIDEIAFQTNILALNAAVEAARAGEAGMGFAVVADEVRNLAQRSAQAARDTSVLIEESINKSRDGQDRVTEVSQAVRRIVGEASKIRALVEQVSSGSAEQTRGIQQISQAIAEIQRVTHSTAAAAEESAAVAQQIRHNSSSLESVVSGFSAMAGNSFQTEAAAA